MLQGLLRGKPFFRRLKSGKRVRVKGLPISKENTKEAFVQSYGDTSIGQILINRKLPPKRVILKDLRRNPKVISQAIKDYSLLTGKKESEVYMSLAKSGYLGVGKDLAVNLGGLLGSISGGNVASVPGALAGDLLGAMATRRMLNNVEILALTKKLGGTPEQRRRNYNFLMRKMKEKMPKEDRKDLIGWGIGNTVATTLPVPLPLRGGLAAMHSAEPIRKGIEARNWRTFLDEQKKVFKGIYGGEYERQFRRRIDAQLEKNLPKFRKHINLINYGKYEETTKRRV